MITVGKRAKVAVVVSSVVLICAFTIFYRIQSRSPVQSKLKELDYWQRAHFQQTTRADWITRTIWARLFQRQRDPAAEMERCQQELIDLGYLMKHSFVLATPVTNRIDYPSFHQAITAAGLPDAHWSYSFNSNRLNVTL